VRALRPHGDINSARRADIYRSRRDHSQNIPQTIGYISLLVRDYDDAITFFTQSLDFHLIEDTPSKDRQGRDKRWVLIAPPGSKGTKILLARASNEEEATRIGNQTGGRVFLFLHTDDFWRDYNRMKEKGVRFIREPKQEEYGKVTVFEDLYGNQWDLLEPKPLSP
jgi:catechol 2,3-dioxygenase-like lactoylglutathione lyase family enzyme